MKIARNNKDEASSFWDGDACEYCGGAIVEKRGEDPRISMQLDEIPAYAEIEIVTEAGFVSYIVSYNFAFERVDHTYR